MKETEYENKRPYPFKGPDVVKWPTDYKDPTEEKWPDGKISVRKWWPR